MPSFADDFHSASLSSNVDDISESLNVAASEMVEWANDNEMSISAPKLTVTLFTPWTRQVNCQLDVKIGGASVPTVKNPKLLG